MREGNSVGWAARAAAMLLALAAAGSAWADSSLGLVKSIAGNVNFVGTQKTYRTKSNANDPCSVKNASNNVSAALSGIPASATIVNAYLYWVASGATPDYTVSFEGTSRTATRQYTATSNGKYFGGVVDVTTSVAAKRNGTYSFSGLTIDNSTDCAVAAVVGGWSLLVVYSDSSQPFRVLNIYEGLKPIQNNSGSPETITVSNFQVPASGSYTGRVGLLVWEGDSDLASASEKLMFGSTELTDSLNTSGNLFSSTSNINGDSLSYGIDFDAFTVNMANNQTSATTTFTTGQDFVLVNMEVLAVPNVAVDDLQITNSTSSTFQRGNTVTYTLAVKNNGPNSETGTITVVDTLPSGLTGGTGAGTGWTCSTSGQTITCTNPNTGGLASGVSANAITITATVATSATGTLVNSATVSGVVFDNVSSNNTATASNAVLTVDLALTKTRNSTLVPGQNASYTLAVSNIGLAIEPGSITLVDTLPSGLSYASYSGSGWSCSASGQTVTCVRSGTLAAGSTSSVVVTVSVLATASGTQLNTATVGGTGYETVTSNNTATDSYIITASQYAWYKLDETSLSGTGALKDASGNARDGTIIGTVTSVTSTNAVATCRAASIASNTNIGTKSGLSVPVLPQNLGLSGTIAFWYKANTIWSNSTGRMLFDATADSGGDYAFYLMKNSNGGLTFALTDSGNRTYASATPNYAYAASSWHHIAVTWSLATGTNGTVTGVYIDGVSVALTLTMNGTATTGFTSTTGAWPTGSLANGDLFFGDTRSTSVQPYNGVSNSANGELDEIYVYPGVLTSAQIGQLYSASHTCSALHHYELALSSTSINCLPTTVTVTACADASAPCTNRYVGVSGSSATVSVPANTATLGATAVTPAVSSLNLTFGSDGMASTAVSYPDAAENVITTVTLSNETQVAPNNRYCCPDGASCSVANSCSSTFNKAAFIVATTAGGVEATATDLNMTAGDTSPQYFLRAIKSVDTGSPKLMACAAALSGVTQAVGFTYKCNNPITCTSGALMGVNGGTYTPVSGNNNGVADASLNYTSVNMTFDTNGNAPFRFSFGDVGQITLYMKSIVNLHTVLGSSAAFVVRPGGFLLSNIKQTATPYRTNTAPTDPAAANSKLVGAGEAFTMTVSAVTTGGALTPNFGNEATPEGVKFDTPLAGLDGSGTAFVDVVNKPALVGTFGTFSGGSATGTAFSWDEVGIMRLTPRLSDGDYLGAGDVTGAVSANIGRFVPHHFGVDSGAVVNRSLLGCSPASGFSYMNEPFGVSFILSARSAAEGVTQNYQGVFKRLTSIDWLNTTAAAATGIIDLRMAATAYDWTAGSTCSVAFDTSSPFATRFACTNGQTNTAIASTAARVQAVGTPAAITWAQGAATMSGVFKLARASAADGPYGGELNSDAALKIGIAPQDSDGVTASGFDLDADIDGSLDHLIVGSTAVRHGKMEIPNMYGSEKLNLPVVLTAKYWNARNARWVTSASDSCTPLTGNLTLTQTPSQLSQATVTTSIQSGAHLIDGQSVGFWLLKPTALTRKASITLSTSSSAPSDMPLWNYLPGTGVMTFGLYKAGPVIFIRENY